MHRAADRCKDKLMNLLGYDDIDDLLSYSTPKVVKVSIGGSGYLPRLSWPSDIPHTRLQMPSIAVVTAGGSLRPRYTSG